MNNLNFAKGIAIIASHMPEDANTERDYFSKEDEDQIFFGEVNWVKDENDLKILDELGWGQDRCWDEKNKKLYWCF